MLACRCCRRHLLAESRHLLLRLVKATIVTAKDQTHNIISCAQYRHCIALHACTTTTIGTAITRPSLGRRPAKTTQMTTDHRHHPPTTSRLFATQLHQAGRTPRHKPRLTPRHTHTHTHGPRTYTHTSSSALACAAAFSLSIAACSCTTVALAASTSSRR